MNCKRGYEVKVLSSRAGWYIGTVDENGLPYCRLTSQYGKTREDATAMALDRQSNCVENEFCNGGHGCFPIQESVVVRIYDINWDIDSEDSGLVVLPDMVTHAFEVGCDPDALEETISDWLSDEFGFCHLGFKYEVLNPFHTT